MESTTNVFLYFLQFVMLFFLLHTPAIAIPKPYIVYFGGHSHGPEPSSIHFDRVTDAHHEFLGSFLGGKENAKKAISASYTKHINGFCATLEEEAAVEISKHPAVVSVFLSREKKLHTTHSWEFLQLVEKNNSVSKDSIWAKSNFGEDVIIGSLDSGVWPESQSFNEKGLGPVPSRWKGFCQNDTKFGVPCNRKLIGARYFNTNYQNGDLLTARDTIGHGTHTLSTAGGRFVPNASAFGAGNGTARGGAPNSRVAMYKVCWPNHEAECLDADILAAFDAAIHDGVDVISISVGSPADDFFVDTIAIGSYHAVMNGIPVVAAGGNDGPGKKTVSNVAPWILTVGASTTDREFVSYVVLGDNTTIKGKSLSENSLPEGKFYPLISAIEAKVETAPDEYAKVCSMGSLDPQKVKGKIVVCMRDSHGGLLKGTVVAAAGGIGLVFVNDEENYFDQTRPEPHVLPASDITGHDGHKVFSYIANTDSPVAYIRPVETQMDVQPSPEIAYFSSRGPNPITPDILKPDIVAPGVSIIAAVPAGIPFSSLTNDKRRVLFNTMSGTSMSCPHVAGIVALLKVIHPDWSPAAIRSAIMTTAKTQSNTMQAIRNSPPGRGTPFSFGAGHIHPNRAMDPGLVYDLTTKDYLNYLCTMDYNKAKLSNFTTQTNPCTKDFTRANFNYPAITVPFLNGSVYITRTVKNVGSPGTYTAKVTKPFGVLVTVEPESLTFDHANQEKAFNVTMEMEIQAIDNYVFGMLEWSDGQHRVRTPISIMEGAAMSQNPDPFNKAIRETEDGSSW